MKRVAFDIETDGLLDELTTIHSLVIRDIDGGELLTCADQPGFAPIKDGLAVLERAELLVGHNVLTFDIPAAQKVHPGWKPTGIVRDTLVISRLIWTDLQDRDFRRTSKPGVFPAKLIGSHGLKAWGHRLGILKGDFGETTDWSSWTAEMQSYCEQDVAVSVALWTHCLEQNYAEQAIELEHDFQKVIFLQERHGIRFDVEKASKLYASLVKRRDGLTADLQTTFPPAVEEMKTPAYWVNPLTEAQYPTKGAAPSAERKLLEKGPNRTKEIPFNPGSRDQIAARLMERGWVPEKTTNTGKPQVDESVLSELSFPEAKLLADYLMVGKRIGQIAEGDNSWLKLERNGRIHGRVLTNGAVTGRCAHFKPNLAQVPRVGSPYGEECRSLFTADPGFVMVGADASGLELRCLAHFMARYDGGAYGREVIDGDIHTCNRDALGLPATKEGRNIAKTWVYGFLYGCGDEKSGRVAGVSPEEIEAFRSKKKSKWSRYTAMQEKRGLPTDDTTIACCVKGGMLKDSFLKAIPALKQLRDDVQKAAKARGFLRGLDGRRLHVRSAHSALNTLLQSAGALLVKQATVILHDTLNSKGLKHGKEYAMVLHVHDEYGLVCLPHLAEQVGIDATAAFRKAGEFFGFRVPLDGEYRIGNDWSQTH